jgi:hypothetical protein
VVFGCGLFCRRSRTFRRPRDLSRSGSRFACRSGAGHSLTAARTFIAREITCIITRPIVAVTAALARLIAKAPKPTLAE